MRRSPNPASPLVALAVVAVMAAIATPCGAAPLKMFTSQVHGKGKLGDWPQAAPATTGLAAANSICAKLALDAGLDNSGAYRAWISDTTTDAYCNVAGYSGRKEDDCGLPQLPDGGPWVRTDGKPFARSLSKLTSGNAVLYESLLGPDGNPVISVTGSTRTGTLANGVWSGADCAGWTSEQSSSSGSIGDWSTGADHWTTWGGNALCDVEAHLYCFESGSVPTSLASFGTPGAYAFVTSKEGYGKLSLWEDANGQQGIAAGTEICRKAARNGHLPVPDSFVPWLSDSTSDAIDSLTIDGPWRRPDGVRIAATKIDLFLFPHDGSISVDEFGNHLGDYVTTGTNPDGRSSGSDCGDWKNDTGNASGGLSSTPTVSWTTSFNDSCGVAGLHLLCFSNVVVLFADGFERDGTYEWSATVP